MLRAEFAVLRAGTNFCGEEKEKLSSQAGIEPAETVEKLKKPRKPDGLGGKIIKGI
jgi:hypothetical protein